VPPFHPSDSFLQDTFLSFCYSTKKAFPFPLPPGSYSVVYEFTEPLSPPKAFPFDPFPVKVPGSDGVGSFPPPSFPGPPPFPPPENINPLLVLFITAPCRSTAFPPFGGLTFLGGTPPFFKPLVSPGLPSRARFFFRPLFGGSLWSFVWDFFSPIDPFFPFFFPLEFGWCRHDLNLFFSETKPEGSSELAYNIVAFLIWSRFSCE